jgi:hypothetical protein
VILNVFNTRAASNLKYFRDRDRDGFFTDLLYRTLGQKNKIQGNNWKTKAKMRLNDLVTILSVIVTRAVDFALGLVAATLSLMSLGCFEKLNFFAYRNLKVLSIFNDFFELLRNFIWLDKNSRVDEALAADYRKKKASTFR